jgi:hypothetical protein
MGVLDIILVCHFNKGGVMRKVCFLIICIVFPFLLCGCINENVGSFQTIYKAQGRILDIKLSNDGAKLLFSESRPNMTLLTMLDSKGKKMWSVSNGLSDWAAGEISVSPDGKYSSWNLVKPIEASGGEVVNSKTYYFDRNGRMLWTNNAEGEIKISTNGRYVLVGAKLFSIQFVKLFSVTGTILATFEQADIDMSSDGEYLLVGERLYENSNGTLKQLNVGNFYAISGDGSLIVGGDKEELFVMRTLGARIVQVRRKEDVVYDIKLSKNSQYVLVDFNDENKLANVLLFNKNGKEIYRNVLNDQGVKEIVGAYVSNDGKFLLKIVDNSYKYALVLYDKNGKLINRIADVDCSNLICSDDFSKIYCVRENSIYKIRM